jgi:N-acetyl sugar amidotransferase
MDYKICAFCVMDTSDPNISFPRDYGNMCNHCWDYKGRSRKELHHDVHALVPFLDQMREDGKGKDHDCIIGLSGGLDSSYVAYNLVQYGIRPLALSIDNEWDMPVAKENVKNLVNKLNIDWEHHPVDQDQYRDFQLAFLKSGVINIEAPTDHAIISMLYKRASQEGLRYIVHGGNIVTECIMPKAWGYNAIDWKQIKAIHRRFGNLSSRGFPHMTLFHWAYYTFVQGIKWFPILNYVDYVPEKAKKTLASCAGWQDYGGKHRESEWTTFFQEYILPRKFGIDKRRAHLSTLINSGFMTRDQALDILKENPPMFDDQAMVEKVCDRLGITVGYFNQLIRSEVVSHRAYPNNEKWFERLKGFVEFAKRRATANA